MIVAATAVTDVVRTNANYVAETEIETVIIVAVIGIVSEITDRHHAGQMNEVVPVTMTIEEDLEMIETKGTNHCKIVCETWPVTEIVMNIIVATKAMTCHRGVMVNHQ